MKDKKHIKSFGEFKENLNISDDFGVTKQEPEVIKIKVKRWKNTDKYPCPKCGTKLGMPSYTCEKCNVKIKPVMNF